MLKSVPMDKAILRKWLKAGFMEREVLHPTENGTPQGGIISPVLANFALDGLVRLLNSVYPKNNRKGKKAKVNLIRYADDFVAMARAERGVRVHTGMANASAAVPVGPGWFLTGSDEDNVLKLYRAGESGPPVAQFDTTPWLALDRHQPEADLEGAARVGDVIYWIGSHSRSKDGRYRPSRQRLLATRLTEGTNSFVLAPVGQPCADVLGALIAAPQLAKFDLRAAAGQPPENEGGLNIEGLAATPEGGLLLGFRGPVPDGKALLVPLLNPVEATAGKPPRLGDPVLLDLDGLGIRDIAWSGREYFLIAGRSGGGGASRLYRWAGGAAVPERIEHPGLKNLNPEGIAVFGSPEKPRLLLVSDDGNQAGNEHKPPAQRTFRTVWVKP